MLVSLHRMRVGARRFATGALLILPVAGCAGDDLLLPNDGSPAQLRAVSGDGQTAPAGSAVRNPLVVEALDAAGRPVEGAVVVFEFVDPPNGAAIAPPVSETDDIGRAKVEVTLGTPAGDQPVEARLDDPDSELSVRFLLTAIQAGNPGGGGDDDGDDDDPPPGDGPEGPGGPGGGGDDGDGGDDEDGGDDGGDGGGGDNDGGGNGGGGPPDDGEGGGGGDGGDDGDDDNDNDSGGDNDKEKGKGGKGKDGGHDDGKDKGDDSDKGKGKNDDDGGKGKGHD